MLAEPSLFAEGARDAELLLDELVLLPFFFLLVLGPLPFFFGGIVNQSLSLQWVHYLCRWLEEAREAAEITTTTMVQSKPKHTDSDS